MDNLKLILGSNCKDTSLKTIMGIHNSVLGLAFGRTILRNYANDWETLNRVLRLSRKTTCKYVVTLLNLNNYIVGIMSNAKYHQIHELMRKFGVFGK